mmetsp:Transcript_91102/g.284990  ORF Transcript_91102/g.284990 Transcript_91102/m.284990 type:complete len:428 (-) Transcript_91102:11-1294(-)
MAPGLEKDEVAPAKVQNLQPEAAPDLVAHAQAQRVEAACAGERRRLREAAEGQGTDVTALGTPGVQRAEGDLADAALVRGAHVVVDRPGHDDQRAVRARPQLLPRLVNTSVEEVGLQTPLVVPVPEAVDMVREEKKDQTNPTCPLHEGVPCPRVGDDIEQLLPSHLPEHPELQQHVAREQHQEGPEGQDNSLEQPGETWQEQQGHEQGDEQGHADPGEEADGCRRLWRLHWHTQLNRVVQNLVGYQWCPSAEPLNPMVILLRLEVAAPHCEAVRGAPAQELLAHCKPRRAVEVVLQHVVSEPLPVGHAEHQRQEDDEGKVAAQEGCQCALRKKETHWMPRAARPRQPAHEPDQKRSHDAESQRTHHEPDGRVRHQHLEHREHKVSTDTAEGHTHDWPEEHLDHLHDRYQDRRQEDYRVGPYRHQEHQ